LLNILYICSKQTSRTFVKTNVKNRCSKYINEESLHACTYITKQVKGKLSGTAPSTILTGWGKIRGKRKCVPGEKSG
jgi:hypothetical protein